MLLALGGMIYFASLFFSNESEVRIRESNLDLVHFTAKWIESELRNIRRDGAIAIEASLRGGKRSSISASYFKKNPEVLQIAISTKKKNISRVLFNKSLFRRLSLKESDIVQLSEKGKRYIDSAFKGKKNIFNASTKNIALLGITFNSAGKVIFMLVTPAKLQKYFRVRKYVDIFAVNEKSEIIIHHDPKKMTSHANIKKNKIVKQIWTSPIVSGQGQIDDPQKGERYLASYTKISGESIGLIAQIPEAIVFQPVKHIRNRNLIIMFIFMAITVFIIYFFTQVITAPILSLVSASHKVEEGEYNVEILSKSKDEIGLLIHSFNTMLNGLEEKQKIKDAFGRFVNKELANQILQNKLMLGGEKRFTAILFSDLRDFTSISEKSDAGEIINLLNQYFTEMVKCVDQTNGIVDKYIGDAIMAHWGALRIKGNETENAINTALMMRKSLELLNKKNLANNKATLRMGIGINCGEVIAGQIGSMDRLEYTVIGDAVNIASRIERLNKMFGTDILITSSALDRIRPIFRTKELPPVKIKGRQDIIKVFSVLGHADDPQTPSDINALKKLLDIGPVHTDKSRKRILMP